MKNSTDSVAGRRDRPALSVVWDNHACMPLRADESFLPQLDRFKRAGVNVVSLNAGFGHISWSEHIRMLSYMRRWIAGRPLEYRLLATVSDIHRCMQDGTLGVTFDIEGMSAVQDNPSMVQTFYELGVRWMLIAYNRNNAAGGGCLDVDGGLTSVGRTLIDEMERVGMVLCLSHTGPNTASDAMAYSRNPVIFSHSNPAGDTRHARNISDELIRGCARSGGVIGLSGVGPYLGGNDQLIERLLRQIRYLINLVGPAHVGLGLDFVFDRVELDEYIRLNPSLLPAGLGSEDGMAMLDPESFPMIVDALIQENLSDSDIQGILGANWMRVATRVWR